MHIDHGISRMNLYTIHLTVFFSLKRTQFKLQSSQSKPGQIKESVIPVTDKIAVHAMNLIALQHFPFHIFQTLIENIHRKSLFFIPHFHFFPAAKQHQCVEKITVDTKCFFSSLCLFQCFCENGKFPVCCHHLFCSLYDHIPVTFFFQLLSRIEKLPDAFFRQLYRRHQICHLLFCLCHLLPSPFLFQPNANHASFRKLSIYDNFST